MFWWNLFDHSWYWGTVAAGTIYKRRAIMETRYHSLSFSHTHTHTHTHKQSCHFSNYIHDTYVKRLHYIITSTEDSPSCVANSSSTSQNILRIFWTLNSLPSSQDSATCPYSGPNRVHDPSSYFPKHHFNITLPSTVRLAVGHPAVFNEQADKTTDL